MLLNKNIPLSFVFKKIKTHAFIILIIIFLTHFFHDWLHIPILPIQFPTFLGTAISVILAFKLNQSYDRWWEARKIWGEIVNDSRNFILYLLTYIKPDAALDVKVITNRHIAWLKSLFNTLRNTHQDKKYLETYIESNEIKELKKYTNLPLAILQLNYKHLNQLEQNAKCNIFSFIELNKMQSRFVETMGKCERIKKTIFPATYRRYLHGIIYLFIVSLSLAIDPYTDKLSFYSAFLFELGIILPVSVIFFLLERTATQLQDPFENSPTDTPMEDISYRIEVNLKEMINDFEPPVKPTEKKYYLM